MKKFLLTFLCVISSAFAFAEDYPVVFDKSKDYTHSSRRLNSISLNGSADGNQTLQLPTPLKIYSNISDGFFKAKAGETLTPTFGYSGAWMHGYVYIDFGQDGAFDATLNSDGSFSADSDIMAFSYAEPVLNSGTGYNSTGALVSYANVLNPPAFEIPSTVPDGYYLMRYKVDWASIDPAGRAEDGNGIIKNGGAVCDVRINIHSDKGQLSVASDNGSVLAADGTALPTEVSFGEAFSIKIQPNDGYKLDAVKVRHGHNLAGEQYLYGVAQYEDTFLPAYLQKEGIITLPAEYVDGDILIEPLFVEVASGEDGAYGYPLSFDKEAKKENSSAGTIKFAYGTETFEAELAEDAVYNDFTNYSIVIFNENNITVTVEDASDELNYYLYIDLDNDGKFFTSLTADAVPTLSSELVSYTSYNGKNSAGEEVASSGSQLPTYTISDILPEGVYRLRVKADVNNISSGGSDEIATNDGFVADFLLHIIRGERSLELVTTNGSINGADYSALPVSVTPQQGFNFQLMAGAPGFEAEQVVVRHGFNLDGEQFVNGNKQWSEEIFEATDELITLDGEYVDGDVQIIAHFLPTADTEWEVVFCDEFNATDGSQPASEWWTRCLRQSATWNRWLSDSEEVVYIEDGKLVTRAIPNPDTSTDNVPMITGGIWSRGKFGFTYGRIEGRIKTNGWTGNFPAFWMMPEDQSGGWPNDGEIDIWEVIDAQERSYHTIHTNWTYNLGNKSNPQSSFNYYTALDRYHVFTLEWDESSLTWFVDGKQVGQYSKSSSSDALSKGQWPFDDNFHIILNQSVGNGSWAANADVTHTYETLFDWVRVYQKKGMENTLGTVGVVDVTARQQATINPVEGGVVVSVPRPSLVAVYDVAGRKVAEAFVDSSHTFSLGKGIYIIDGCKVAVK